MNTPILLKIAEATGIEAHDMILRDQNLELMDQYLTNGKSRSIPIFLSLLIKNGEEKAVWGPRAPKVQEFVMELRSALPPKEDESSKLRQKEVYKKKQKLLRRLLKTTNLWNEVYNSIKATLKNA